MTHEGNEQVKETKALTLILKYESFKMEEDETIEDMFSMFQTLVVGLKVLNKGYNTADHVKKIIRSLPKKWRPIVTTPNMLEDLNRITLEKLVSSLRSHEINLEDDDPQRKENFVALKSKGKQEKTNALQDEEEEYEEGSDEEDELFTLSRRVNQLYKQRHKKSKGYK